MIFNGREKEKNEFIQNTPLNSKNFYVQLWFF